MTENLTLNMDAYLPLRDVVFNTLREAILKGELKPGERLMELQLAAKLGVSRTPIREAIFRLKQEHLVEEKSNGICVVGVTEQDLYDIYEIRKRIEGYATGRCAALITYPQLQELQEIVDLQEFYTSKGIADNIRDTDTKFHEMIYSFCGSRMLQATLTDLHRKVRKYRKLSVEDPNRARIAMCEHRNILDALSRHDSAEAEYLAVLHIENARKNIVMAATKQVK